MSFVALPLLVAVILVVVASPRLDRVRPESATRTAAVLLVLILSAALPTLWLIGLSGLAHAGLHNPIIDWSRHLLPDHPPLGAVVGIASLIAAVVGSVRVAHVLLHHRRIRCTDTCALEMVESDEVFAYTLPGPSATIAVSRGLRNRLDGAEFAVVLTHEQAHARHRHDRFLLLALVAVAFVPPIRRLAARLRFYLERSADEYAVCHTGADRAFVARTIAKVALAGPGPAAALGVGDHGVAARATALLEPSSAPAMSARILSLALVGASLALTVAQLHHTFDFAGGLAI